MAIPRDAAHPSEQLTGQSKAAPTQRTTRLPKRLRKTREAQDEMPAGAVIHTQPGRVDVARQRAFACARIAKENRARDIVVLDLRGVTSLVDFFVIATASSRRLAKALLIEIDMAMKKAGETKLGLEGSADDRWMLIDYGDFVVHIFSEEARAYYALDELWGDAPRVDWTGPAWPVPRERES